MIFAVCVMLMMFYMFALFWYRECTVLGTIYMFWHIYCLMADNGSRITSVYKNITICTKGYIWRSLGKQRPLNPQNYRGNLLTTKIFKHTKTFMNIQLTYILVYYNIIYTSNVDSKTPKEN